MSRSNKKLSIYIDKRDKKDKRWANKKVRQLPIDFYLPNGNKWKTLFESWDICDWKIVLYESDIDEYWDEEKYNKGFRK